MLGFGGNALGGTTITDDKGVRGFTKYERGWYVAFVVSGHNMTRIGARDSDLEAVGMIMARRHAVSAA